MSTKPTDVPIWDSNSTNCIAITSGHKTDGYVSSEIPASGETNERLREVGLWCEYLSDGDIELHTLKVDTTLEVDGTTDFKGGVTTEAGFAHTDTWEVFVPALQSVNLSNMAANRNSVLTSGSGAFSYETTSLNQLMRSGDRIRSITFGHVLTHGVTVDFRKVDITGTSTSIITTTATGTGETTFDLTGASHPVGPSNSASDDLIYYLAITSSGGNAAGAGEGITAMYVEFDHPTP